VYRVRLGVSANVAARLEQAVFDLNEGLPALTSFVLPGGSPGSAHAHLARTIVRRAERRVISLAQRQTVNPEVVRALNRLSDLLFVIGRRLNEGGAGDVLWQPGQSSRQAGGEAAVTAASDGMPG
jgi:cob(I)alamin adenosyltransferase